MLRDLCGLKSFLITGFPGLGWNNKHTMKHYRIILAIFLTSLLTGCGYSLYRGESLPFKSVNIKKISNFTTEPRLQDILYRELTEEFLRYGIDVKNTSDTVIEGKIKDFNVITISEKNDYASEYKVRIKVDFKLTDSEGNVRELKNISSPFIEDFQGSDSINRIIANKEDANTEALNRLAMILVSELLY